MFHPISAYKFHLKINNELQFILKKLKFETKQFTVTVKCRAPPCQFEKCIWKLHWSIKVVTIMNK